jgi:hypothetical protein
MRAKIVHKFCDFDSGFIFGKCHGSPRGMV